MGGDDAVVAAARVSNGVDYSEASKGPEQDQKLISYLLKHRHGTPFEHSTFTYYVKTTLFVRSEWHRHRIASYNEISGRYVEYEPEFYSPNQYRVQATSNKQGSVEDDSKTEDWHLTAKSWVDSAWRNAYSTYQQLLRMGVAKEMARMVLPLNLYTQFYFTVNARSLMNFLELRCAENAQWEIRQYALAIRDTFREVMPMTYKAFQENGFVAP